MQTRKQTEAQAKKKIKVLTQFMENLYSYHKTSSDCVHLNMSKEAVC